MFPRAPAVKTRRSETCYTCPGRRWFQRESAPGWICMPWEAPGCSLRFQFVLASWSGGAGRVDIIEVLEVRRRAGRGGEGVHQLEESLLLGFLRNESLLGLRETLFLKLLERLQGFEEGTLEACRVAVEQRQELGVEGFGLESRVLAVADTIQAPVGLGHFFDQQS